MPLPSSHNPSPGNASTASTVLLTVKLAACTGLRATANPVTVTTPKKVIPTMINLNDIAASLLVYIWALSACLERVYPRFGGGWGWISPKVRIFHHPLKRSQSPVALSVFRCSHETSAFTEHDWPSLYHPTHPRTANKPLPNFGACSPPLIFLCIK